SGLSVEPCSELQTLDSGALLPGTHCSERHGYLITSSAPAIRLTEFMEYRGLRDQPDSGLIFANLITLAHFSVSAAMSVPKSAGEPASTMPPSSASRALILGLASAALVSRLSLSTMAAGVALGAPKPHQLLSS